MSSETWKREWYRNGWFVVPLAPVPTRQWLESDWIKWIDTAGAWRRPSDDNNRRV
jgi:hypothetical protein